MEKRKFTSDEKKLFKFYRKQWKENRIPTTRELRKYIKKNKLKFKSKSKAIKKIRRNYKPAARFSQRKKVKFHQTVTIDNLGLISADFAFYKKEFKWFNNNYIGFLMVVSVNASKHHAVPMKNRKMESFEKALEEICLSDIFSAVNTVISDRESAVWSQKFQDKMKEKYNIQFEFMYRMNKSWSAENAIRHTKNKLSQFLDGKDDYKNWVKILSQVIADHNRKDIKDTGYTPNEINDKNFFDFLNKLHGTKDVTMNYSTNSISFSSIPKDKWREETLPIDVGDKVLASYKSFESTKIMQKPSVDGTYSDEPYFIYDGFLRNTKSDELVPGKIFFINVILINKIIIFFFFQFMY